MAQNPDINLTPNKLIDYVSRLEPELMSNMNRKELAQLLSGLAKQTPSR